MPERKPKFCKLCGGTARHGYSRTGPYWSPNESHSFECTTPTCDRRTSKFSKKEHALTVWNRGDRHVSLEEMRVWLADNRLSKIDNSEDSFISPSGRVLVKIGDIGIELFEDERCEGIYGLEGDSWQTFKSKLFELPLEMAVECT